MGLADHPGATKLPVDHYLDGLKVVGVQHHNRLMVVVPDVDLGTAMQQHTVDTVSVVGVESDDNSDGIFHSGSIVYVIECQ